MTRVGRHRQRTRWGQGRNQSHRASEPEPTPGPPAPALARPRTQPAWNAPTRIDWRAATLLLTPAQRYRANGGRR
ncbi:hypothetical protein [Micromonospora sp. ATA51]|uniref:hypothetical protein n=1 Tax=Micromonospora sp. ATA51 TaxID=2806098 RepID=UPI001A552DDC|nr:hypothetical protein [Micromonospora sp. ATA51]MBM0228058.1 hypothetical protein [Micromonospora sp. ATA51]